MKHADDNQVVFNFAYLIYRDVQEYIANHQIEYKEWLENEEQKDFNKRDRKKAN
jgi:hypothetical protein